MTRREFILADKRNAYGVVLPAFVVLLAMVAVPMAWIGLQSAHPDMPLLARIGGHVICVGLCTIGVWFVYIYLYRVAQRQQYWCPSCRNGFGGTEKMVLSSGKCHYCGFQVIEDIT
jgi:hypothetical protein